jgi:hypothetical protein
MLAASGSSRIMRSPARRRTPECALSLSKGTRFDELSAHDKSYLLRCDPLDRRPSTRASSSSMTSAATRSSSRSGRDTSRPRIARSRVTSPDTPSRPKSRGQTSRESCVVPE